MNFENNLKSDTELTTSEICECLEHYYALCIGDVEAIKLSISKLSTSNREKLLRKLSFVIGEHESLLELKERFEKDLVIK